MLIRLYVKGKFSLVTFYFFHKCIFKFGLAYTIVLCKAYLTSLISALLSQIWWRLGGILLGAFRRSTGFSKLLN